MSNITEYNRKIDSDEFFNFRKNILQNFKHLRIADVYLPTIQVYLINDEIYISTKKIASRYFEELSKKKFCEFRIERILTELKFDDSELDDSVTPPSDDLEIFLNSYHLQPNIHNKDDFSKEEFYKLLKIEKLEDIFLKKNERKINIVLRHPVDRLFSALVEIVDEIVGQVIYSEHHRNMFFSYFNIPPSNEFSIKGADNDVISKIMDEYCRTVISKFTLDVHTSKYISFIRNEIVPVSKNKINFIIIDPRMKTGVTNKEVYMRWVAGSDGGAVSNFLTSFSGWISDEYFAFSDLENNFGFEQLGSLEEEDDDDSTR